MSFAIAAVYKKREVYLAADTKASPAFSKKSYKNISKITQVSKNVAISFCGNVDFCQKCLTKLLADRKESRYNTVTASAIEKEFLEIIDAEAQIWTREYFGKFPDAVFLVAGYDSLDPYISMITLSEKGIQSYNHVFHTGDYQFVAVPPSNMNFSDCIQLGSQHFLQSDNAHTTPEPTLEALVKKVAELSEFVNDQAEIWKALPLFGLH